MSLQVMSIFSLALLVFQLTVVRGQSTDGFISIDCGLPKDHTYDERFNGLPYISDSGFINTGEIQTVSSEFFNTNSPESYLRSFPNGTRNCYEIKPVKQGTKYLVRARFLYGNYDGKNKFPMFDLYMGINYWETISISNLDVPLEFEIWVVTVSNSLSICLVNTEHGIPFVSVIELRPLPNDLYVKASTSQSLVMLDRQNLGGNDLIRYPKDIYDRFWFTDINTSQWNVSTNPSSVLTSPFGEPSSVMQSMVYPNTSTDLSFSYSRTSAGDCPSTRAYIILYFAELERFIGYESRIFNVWVNNDNIDRIDPSYLKTSILEKSISFTGNLTFRIVKDPTLSTKPPILNAFEVYRIIDLTCQSETRGLDVDAITEIKSFYKVKRNWNGDPCAPKAFIWEGLNCSYNGTNSPLITSLNLSSSGLTGEIPASLANLSALQYLDLSSNSLTGEIPDSLSRLTQLKVLNLANNSLTGSIPKELLHMSTNGQLKLSTDGNPNLCTKADSCQEGSSKKNNKVLIIVISCIVVVVLVVLAVSIAVWNCKGQRQLKVNQTTRFTKRKLRKITQNFDTEIGKGGYGKVYRGKLDNGNLVAVKVLIKYNLSTSGVAGFQAEADILTKIHHKNLVKLIGYCDDDVNNFALVYEYMEGGSLHDHLSDENKRTQLSWRKRLQIAYEVAQGLKYLHKDCGFAIIHRDIKPGNILLTKNLEARIADFGLSKMFEDDRANATHISGIGAAGTPGYQDPEYVTTKKLRDKSDVYSFGVFLMELITGLHAFIESDQNIHISDWVQERLSRNEIEEIIDETIKGQYDKNSVLGFAKIAQACTKKESKQRPDITEVVKDLEELCTAHDNSPPPRSDNTQQVGVVGSYGEEADDVPLRQT